MQRISWLFVMAMLLAACRPQSSTGTPIPPGQTLAVAASKPGNAPKPTDTTAAPSTASSLSQPAIHQSSSDPNAPNLIVVRDQPIVNGGVTIDSVTAAQAGWLVIYLAQKGTPGHQLGLVPIPMGKSQQIVVPLNQYSGVAINGAVLAGRQLFAVLQAGSKAPGAPVKVAGRSVLEAFTLLPSSNP